MSIRRISIILAASCVLTACNESEWSTRSEQTLTVQGAPEDVARFAALQGSLRPALRTSTVDADEAGMRKLVVHQPENFGCERVVHITREALAAGLEYKYHGERVTRRQT